MIEFVVVAFAVVILVAVVRWTRPIRPITALFLTLFTGAWIWANLRTSGWQEVFNQDPPEGLDPVTRAMYWRGWPLAPAMLCLIHGNRIRPGGGEVLALAFDWVVLFAALSLAGFVCKRCSRRRDVACPPNVDRPEMGVPG